MVDFGLWLTSKSHALGFQNILQFMFFFVLNTNYLRNDSVWYRYPVSSVELSNETPWEVIRVFSCIFTGCIAIPADLVYHVVIFIKTTEYYIFQITCSTPGLLPAAWVALPCFFYRTYPSQPSCYYFGRL